MYRKICPDCEKASYSSDDNSWECPYCGRDMSSVEKNVAGSNEECSPSLNRENHSSVLQRYLNDSRQSLDSNSNGGE